MKRLSSKKGFTTIELIVVIIVAVILIAVVAFAYKGVEARNRNQDREVAVNATQKQLEAYFQNNDHYPSRRDLNDADWLKTSMKSLDTSLLRDPSGQTEQLSEKPTVNQYAYQPSTDNGNSCEDNDQLCTAYSLTATLEGGGQYIKQNSN